MFRQRIGRPYEQSRGDTLLDSSWQYQDRMGLKNTIFSLGADQSRVGNMTSVPGLEMPACHFCDVFVLIPRWAPFSTSEAHHNRSSCTMTSFPATAFVAGSRANLCQIRNSNAGRLPGYMMHRSAQSCGAHTLH